MHSSPFICAAAILFSPAFGSPVNQLDARAGTTGTYGDYSGSTSSYSDGSGTHVSTDDVGTYASGVKCWTDLHLLHSKANPTPHQFYVSSSYEAKEWRATSDTVDCALTSFCASGTITGTQKCTSWTLGASIEGKWDVIKKVLDVTGTLNGAGGRFECETAQSTTTCNWDDMKCHALWTSDVELVNKGYVRRRCHDKGQDYTAWSKDWNINSPEKKTRLGCGALCSDTQYPGPVPLPPGAQG
ncbi:MAG: hypothetical protein Q9169_004675 [Polycauliona sp. 2 TL-2023]